VTRFAVLAFTAAIEGQDDMIARRYMSDVCADRFDDARAFMTKHDRRRRREVKMHGRDVRMA
jgi:hypothetical protein